MSETLLPIETSRGFRCPFCKEHVFTLDHVKVGSEYWWSCGHCGKGVHFFVHAEGVTCEPDPPNDLVKRWIVLERGALRFVLECNEPKDGYKRRAYYYNDHTCPVNWLDQVVEVFDGQEEDPHGCFTFAGAFESITDAEEFCSKAPVGYPHDGELQTVLGGQVWRRVRSGN